MARKVVDVWAGAQVRRGYTMKHQPLLWECMLGTVNAVNPKGEEKYFDYEWADAHAWIELDKYEDLRVCKVKYHYADWPLPGKWALFGKKRKEV
jgi:hypothetical protein